MWLNVKWYDASNNLLREDGAYGPLFDEAGAPVTVPDPAGGPDMQVETLLDLDGTNTKIIEAHYGMTQEWASQLLTLEYDPGLVLGFDRLTGAVDYTLADLGAQAPGSSHETFHFVLNNTVIKDNRIPPYGMSFDEARKRNALPVPADQYGGGTPGSTYSYWAEFGLTPPGPEAVYASVDLKYQPTSWEYIQFLLLANNGTNPFLAEEGINMLEAWLHTGMAAPYTMASAQWGSPPEPMAIDMIVDSLSTWTVAKRSGFGAPSDTFSVRDTVGLRAHVADSPDGVSLSGAQAFMEIYDPSGALEVSLQGFTDDAGQADFQWKTSRRQATGVYTVEVVEVLKNGYSFLPGAGQTSVTFTVQ
jgi:hypothetical protein